MEDNPGSGQTVRDTIDREVDLVNSAIDLVAVGGAPTATVAGLRLTDAVVRIVETHAHEQGVVVEVLWGADESSQDVRVRRDLTPR